MPILAGQKITAARLNWDSGSTPLTDGDAFTAVGGFQQWGTEEVTFTDPGVPVKVLGWLSGRVFDNTDTDAAVAVRLGISFDGGSTFSYGNSPQINVGTAGSARTSVAVQHAEEGTPTGDIVLRAEVDVTDDDVDARNGNIMAILVPE